MKLSDIFGSHMVIQRDRDIIFYGDADGTVTIDFAGERRSAEADGGRFEIRFPAMSAGGPYTAKAFFSDGTEETLSDILIGDVYIAGGQSNMQFQLRESFEGASALTDMPNVRFFNEPHIFRPEGCEPYKAFEPVWKPCTGDNALSLSAVAYFFALRRNAAGVPIGIISSNRGGSRVESWTPKEDFEAAGLDQLLEGKRHRDYDYAEGFNKHHRLFSAKMSYILPFPVKAVLWYQGESDSGYMEAGYYLKQFSVMVRAWRRLMNYDTPFFTVQLMPYSEGEDERRWAVTRECQRLASEIIPGVALVTLFDTGEEKLIHPTKKQGVGFALADAVGALLFGEDREFCGPLPACCVFSAGRAEVTMSHADGMFIDGERLTDAKIKLRGKDWEDAVGYCDGRRLILSAASGESGDAVGVSLGFCNAPKLDLKNSAGYLASPFIFPRPSEILMPEDTVL